MQIILERSADAISIRRVTEAAFKGVQYSEETEGRIIDALRAAGALALSIIAVENAEILGHVAFSPVQITDTPIGWYGLGPVSGRIDKMKASVSC